MLQRNSCSFALEIQRVWSIRAQDIVFICRILQQCTWDVARGTGRLAPNVLRKLHGIVFIGHNVTEELTH